MAEERTKVEIEFGAKLDALTAGLAQVQDKIGGLGKQITEKFAPASTAVDKLTSSVKSLVGTFLSWATIRAAVQTTADLGIEAEKLGRQLGTTAAEASILAVALGDVYATVGEFGTATQFLTRQLRTNEERLNALGLVTRDGNGNLKDQKTLMLDAISVANSYRQGTDRNAASQELFGRNAVEMQNVLKLNSAALADAKRKADDLGLTLTKEGKQSLDAYRASMNDAGDVANAFKKVLGDALMPILTNISNFINSHAREALTGFRVSVALVTSAVWGLILVLQMAVEIVYATVRSIVQGVVMLADIATKALLGDWDGIIRAWKGGTEQIGDTWGEAVDNIVRRATEARTAMGNAFSPGTEGAGADDTGGTKTFRPKQESRVSGWDAQLAEQRDAHERMMLEQGSFQQFSRQMEADYWKAILDRQDLTKEERIAVTKKYYDAERDIRKEAFESEIGSLKAQLEGHKAGAAQRVAILNEVATRVRERFGAESKEAKAAMADVAAARREHADREIKLMEVMVERRRAAAAGELDLERERLNKLEALGAISEETKLLRFRELKQQEFQIELAAAESRAQLLADDTLAYEQEMNRIAEIKQRQRVDMARIDREIAVAGMREWRRLFDAITSGFSQAIKGVIMGTQTLGEAVNSIFQTLVLSIIDLGVKMLAEQILNSIMATAVQKTAAASEITGHAAVAAAASMASVAAIPFVGWAMAPAVGAETFAAAMGYQAALASAAGGYDIPAGVNPVVQTHEREMILPEHIADPLRDMVAGGGGRGMGITVKAFDSKDVARGLRDGGVLQKAFRRMRRNFAQM